MVNCIHIVKRHHFFPFSLTLLEGVYVLRYVVFEMGEKLCANARVHHKIVIMSFKALYSEH